MVTFIRLPDVKARTGLSRAAIYGLIQARLFPAQVRLGPRAVGWVEEEIDRWQTERVSASRPSRQEGVR
jgi:prophage regulatory protein